MNHHHGQKQDDNSGALHAEDLLSASLLGIVDAPENLSQNMHGYHVTTQKDSGKNQASFKTIIKKKKKKSYV